LHANPFDVGISRDPLEATELVGARRWAVLQQG
jgi:hypothetical protein